MIVKTKRGTYEVTTKEECLEFADKIRDWRNNDNAGYNGAIRLLCDAEDMLRNISGVLPDDDFYTALDALNLQ